MDHPLACPWLRRMELRYQTARGLGTTSAAIMYLSIARRVPQEVHFGAVSCHRDHDPLFRSGHRELRHRQGTPLFRSSLRAAVLGHPLAVVRRFALQAASRLRTRLWQDDREFVTAMPEQQYPCCDTGCPNTSQSAKGAAALQVSENASLILFNPSRSNKRREKDRPGA